MPRKNSERSEPASIDQATPLASPDPGTALARLTPDQLDRWAGLIAAGQDEFPENLAAADRERLAEIVRHRLTDRLIRYIAQAIAAELNRGKQANLECSSHATNEL